MEKLRAVYLKDEVRCFDDVTVWISTIQWNLEMWTPLGPEEDVQIREVS